jgi:pimeloyl-ACP methyl ester carboxylesterase
VFLELGTLAVRIRELRGEPRGDGRKVVLIPGFLADDRSTWPLRQFLSFLGYGARGWGLGRNEGDPEAAAAAFIERLESLREEGQQLTLIGWSLGGVVARLVAMQRPDAVREVITLGTPVEGGPKYTSAGEFYAKKRGIDLDAFEQHVHALNEEGIEVPLTVVYSRTDAIVSWRAAIDRYNPHAKHVEVRGSHVGLGFNADVWRIIARVLHASGDMTATASTPLVSVEQR